MLYLIVKTLRLLLITTKTMLITTKKIDLMNKINKYLDFINLITSDVKGDLTLEGLKFDLRKVLIEKQNHHSKMMLRHKKIVEDIQLLLNTLEEEEIKEKNINQESKLNKYRTKEFWKKHIRTMFKEKNRALKTNEILDSLHIPKDERRNCMTILSNTMIELYNEKELIRYKIEGEKGYYYESLKKGL